jgi:hypothetical protein
MIAKYKVLLLFILAVATALSNTCATNTLANHTVVYQLHNNTGAQTHQFESIIRHPRGWRQRGVHFRPSTLLDRLLVTRVLHFYFDRPKHIPVTCDSQSAFRHHPTSPSAFIGRDDWNARRTYIVNHLVAHALGAGHATALLHSAK